MTRPFYRSLYVQVLAGIVLGVILGVVWPEKGAAMKPLGDGFIKLIKMLIAPNAPIGASRMIMPTIVNSVWESCSIAETSIRARSPCMRSATPKSSDTTSTWRMSPRTKPSTTVTGMTFNRKSTVPVGVAPEAADGNAENDPGEHLDVEAAVERACHPCFWYFQLCALPSDSHSSAVAIRR